ncbi:EAL domain-containing protein [Bacillus kwashiorkori]|uniref:EAL domain-containing protein n=1 Tax=Bacillus kwashiorkori TaxID=1522318 RepID=UPI0007849AD5|nr:EAL domain-containing protein [Bacillus kwashiorkori]
MGDIIIEMIKQQKFTNVFQPVFQVNVHLKKIMGYESLIRTPYFKNLDTLFNLAHISNHVFELDTASIKNSLRIFNQFFTNNDQPYILINIFPSTIVNPCFLSFLEKMEKVYPEITKKLVFEINEAENTEDIALLKNTTEYLQKRGYLIALDDIGKGYSSLKMVVEIEPDIMKIDKFFANGLHKERNKQKLLEAIVQYVDNQKKIILEGIEYEEDLQVANEIGIDLVQGFLLGKPKPLLEEEKQRILLMK